MKIKIILGVIVISLLTLSVIFMKNGKDGEDQIDYSFSRNSDFTEDDLVNASEIIVKAEVKKVKEKSIKESSGKNSDGTEYSMNIPRVLYEVEVLEDIKNDSDKGKIDVSVLDGLISGKQFVLEEGKQYILFLCKHKSENSYVLVDYDTGAYKRDGKSFKGVTSNTTKTEQEIKDMVNKVKNKKIG